MRTYIGAVSRWKTNRASSASTGARSRSESTTRLRRRPYSTASTAPSKRTSPQLDCPTLTTILSVLYFSHDILSFSIYTISVYDFFSHSYISKLADEFCSLTRLYIYTSSSSHISSICCSTRYNIKNARCESRVFPREKRRCEFYFFTSETLKMHGIVVCLFNHQL